MERVKEDTIFGGMLALAFGIFVACWEESLRSGRYLDALISAAFCYFCGKWSFHFLWGGSKPEENKGE